MAENDNAARRLTGWAALVGAGFAIANVVLVVAMSGSDQGLILHGESMLSLPASSRSLFEAAMAADIFGFYFPFIAIGALLWHEGRAAAGALADMAMIAMVLYIALGTVGAALDMAALEPLSQMHAGGDAATRQAASAAWTGLAGAVQNGLWLFEGPLVLFWTLVVGRHLKSAGYGYPTVAKIIGYCFGVLTLTGLIPGLGLLGELLETVVVLLLPLWMVLLGLQLLRARKAAAIGNA